MNKETPKCKVCGEDFKSSQFARRKYEGMPAVKHDNNLVCRNYPKCPKAEKEVR